MVVTREYGMTPWARLDDWFLGSDRILRRGNGNTNHLFLAQPRLCRFALVPARWSINRYLALAFPDVLLPAIHAAGATQFPGIVRFAWLHSASTHQHDAILVFGRAADNKSLDRSGVRLLFVRKT